MTPKEAIVLLNELRDSYHPQPDLKARTIGIYAEMLASEFDAKTLAAAILVLPKTCKFFPSIAEIRTACLEVSGARAKLPAPGEAYAEARRGARKFGAYVKPVSEDFSHAIVYRAALQAAGSWRRWCLTDEEVPLRAKFFDCYRELRQRELTAQAVPESHRALTSEESRALLEDVNARAQRKRLRAGEEDEIGGEDLVPISDLLRSKPLPEHDPDEHVVGSGETSEEFEERKARIRKIGEKLG